MKRLGRLVCERCFVWSRREMRASALKWRQTRNEGDLDCAQLCRAIGRVCWFAHRLLQRMAVFVFAASALAVIVEWDANPEPEVNAYNVYWGRFPRGYENVLRVTNGTQAQIVLSNAAVFYFAVTALADELESPFSEEVSWMNAPGAPQVLRIRRETNAVTLLVADSVSGPWLTVTGFTSPQSLTNAAKFITLTNPFASGTSSQSRLPKKQKPLPPTP
jgi:hypothetical protein